MYPHVGGGGSEFRLAWPRLVATCYSKLVSADAGGIGVTGVRQVAMSKPGWVVRL